uniref:Uncharacterized protein n=1 Tax=Rhizophora mucronata TaxID=61149 RepID=A0A2P2QPQ7_RHIMU
MPKFPVPEEQFPWCGIERLFSSPSENMASNSCFSF